MRTPASTRTVLAITAIITVPASAGIYVHSASASAAESPQRASTMTLLQRDGHLTFIDVGPQGGETKPPSRGDQYVLSNRLIDPSTKKRVGTVHIVCTTTVPGKRAIALCDHVFDLPDGTVTAQSVAPLSKARETMALTGGTGDYAGVRGTIAWDGSGSGELSSYTVTFLD
jgi:hypothetical protein